jgi:hypothetical protein
LNGLCMGDTNRDNGTDSRSVVLGGLGTP